MKVHVHKWERVDFLNPLLAYECECGAAMSIHPDKTYYSPRKPINNVYIWKIVSIAWRGNKLRGGK